MARIDGHWRQSKAIPLSMSASKDLIPDALRLSVRHAAFAVLSIDARKLDANHSITLSHSEVWSFPCRQALNRYREVDRHKECSDETFL